MAQMTHFMPSGLGVLEILSFSGNIIPHAWYTQITSESGRPDHNAISIFSEIIYWYRPGRGGTPKFADDIWRTSYEHFETRFGYNNQRTRRALIRLEELGLIRREFRTIKKYGQTNFSWPIIIDKYTQMFYSFALFHYRKIITFL